MSRDILHDLMNYDEVIERFKEFTGLDSKKKIAKLFGIKQNSFSNQKKSGGIIRYFVKHGIQFNMNLNWLFTGKGIPQAIDESSELASLRSEFNTLNGRLFDFERDRNVGAKIRKDDPAGKKDEFIKLRAV